MRSNAPPRKRNDTLAEPIVFLNGRMLPASQAHLAIYDGGVVLGATVTEMTRTFGQRLWRLHEHIDRLYRSLRYTRLETGMSKPEMIAASQQLIEHNRELIDPGDELGLIHFVTPGEFATYAGSAAGSAHLRPTVCAHTFPMPFELWAKKMASGAHVVTPSIRHVPPQCYDPKMKYRSRMHYFLADQEARLADADAVALLLDLEGNVTETSGSNFLIVEEGVIVSPTLRNILPGISRAMVMSLAEELGIRFVERDFQVFNVMNADEAFMTSTPYCIMPVTRVNGVAIGEGKPGRITNALLQAWSEKVGVDILRQIQVQARRRTESLSH